MSQTGRSNRVPSPFELSEDTLRAHLEAVIGVIDSGSPRMFARLHLYAMREILDGAEHLVQRDGTSNAIVPDVVPKGD